MNLSLFGFEKPIDRHMWKGANTDNVDRRLLRILDFDPDLGVDLDPARFHSAAADLVAPTVRMDWPHVRGRWGPRDAHGHLGLLILEGLLLREVRLLGTGSAEVLGAGDLLRPWDTDGEHVLPTPVEVHWTTLAPCRVAILDARFLARAARWPDVLARLTGRSVARAKALALHDAITNLKHVETRVLVQFWHLAERWGTVSIDGISVPVPLTHDMLAKLVGATRPSVTTALGRLATRGLLVREDQETWRLAPDSREALAPLPVQPDTRLPVS